MYEAKEYSEKSIFSHLAFLLWVGEYKDARTYRESSLKKNEHFYFSPSNLKPKIPSLKNISGNFSQNLNTESNSNLWKSLSNFLLIKIRFPKVKSSYLS